MDFLEELIKNLYEFLANADGSNTKVIRRHTKNLENLGDLSFPRNLSSWRGLIKTDESGDIFQYLNRNETDLITFSEGFLMKLRKCFVIKDNVHLQFDRTICYAGGIKKVLETGTYGSCDLSGRKFALNVHVKGNSDVSELRVRTIRDVTENLIRFCNGTVCEQDEDDVIKLVFSLKSGIDGNVCLCGAVLNKNGVKDRLTTADEYINHHIIHMRLMAEHKYGLRITSQRGWKEVFEKLGIASATIELLQYKVGNTVNRSDTASNNKGSSFILYNCARLSRLFKEFDKRVDSKQYPPLPSIEGVDFSLLTEPEEWELFYVYVAQFPACIKSCLRDVTDGKVYLHFLVQHLSGFCSVFSVYYQRVKILTEPREHLFPTLFAKIYLLKSLERVMHVGLRLLNIQPIRQM